MLDAFREQHGDQQEREGQRKSHWNSLEDSVAKGTR